MSRNHWKLLRRREDEEEHQQRRRHAEGDDVGQRVELGAEQGLAAAHPRQPAVERVEDGGAEDELDRVAVVLGWTWPPR